MSKKLFLKKIGTDEDGYLSFFQDDNLGFEIKRIYYVYGVNNGFVRGFHAHKHLKQFAWCPYGDITFSLDDGKEIKRIRLNHPSNGLFINNGIWHEMIWNKADSVLCVAASMHYDEKDYIRDYDEFLRLVKEGYWHE